MWQVVPVVWNGVESQYLRGVAGQIRGFFDGPGRGASDAEMTPAALRLAGLGSRQWRIARNVLDVDRYGVVGPGEAVSQRAEQVWEAFWRVSGPTRMRVAVGRPEHGWMEREAVWDVRERWRWLGDGSSEGVLEDRPWSGKLVRREQMREVPVWWRELITPVWRTPDAPHGKDRLWPLGAPMPPWTADPVQRARVAVRVREFGRVIIPLAADLDQVQGVLPRSPGWAWLVRAGNGWCFCWAV